MAAAADPAITTVGPRVKALREAMDLSLRDLAQRSGVSAPMLSQVERGETSPTLAVAARIASGLELRLSQLLRLDEDGAGTIVRAGEALRGGVGAGPPPGGGAARGGAGPGRPARGGRPGAARAPTAGGPAPRRCPASAPSSRATASPQAPPPAAPAIRRCTSRGAARRRSSS